MEKIQIPKLKILLPILFLSLLFLTPFLSATMRSSYILNLLIVFLGLEAGFLSSAASKSSDDESIKRSIFNTIGFGATYITTCSQGNTTDASVLQPHIVLIKQIPKHEMAKKEAIIKKCKSRPSIFFIGSDHQIEIDDSAGKNEVVIIVKEMEANIIIPTMKRIGKEEKIISKHDELHIMTDTFIRNFYKQLKVDADLEILGKVA